MRTTIKKDFSVEEPIEKVWDYLANPTKIVTCVPGASITEEIDDRNFKGEVSMKFGPVKAKYSGEITIQELDVEAKNMVMKGRGLDSKGKGSADMIMNGNLKPTEKGTDVSFSMEVSIIGMLAQFGSRLINDVSDQLLNQFVTNFKAKLAGSDEVDNSINAGAMVGTIVKNKIGGLFGGKKEKEQEEQKPKEETSK
ncbi:MAG: SRPBCC family protein [Saprospiraceae bacterium]|nr:SRPBCC family protein [Saprospiraceae bacterium]